MKIRDTKKIDWKDVIIWILIILALILIIASFLRGG